MKICLSVIKGPHSGKSFEFSNRDTFVVGRASYAHFRLPQKDPYFSRAHFLVEVNPPFCRLLDLSSSNGTFVNGNRVTQIDLNDGDTILGGDTVIQVKFLEPWETPPVNAEPGRIDRPRVTVKEPLPADDEKPARHADGPRVTQIESPAAPGNAGDDISDQRVASTIAPGPFPSQLDKYKIIKELGRGGMGIVYLAQDRSDGQKLAIKTISPQRAATPREVKQFLREASVLQQLIHPNVVAFLDSGEVDKTAYFAMEYVQGHNAQQILEQQGPLSVKLAIGIVYQLLVGLDYAHAKGFVHRDIKPANLLVRKNSQGIQIKLSDFGLAKVYQASQMSGLTMHGEMGGSMGFLAPEQITNYRHTTPSADLYSAAATLYHLLTGKLIYDFPAKLSDRVLLILQNDPVPITHRRSDIPDVVAAIIERGLSRKPSDRFANAREMLAALASLGK